MVFRLANTNTNPAHPRGFAQPGAGAQAAGPSMGHAARPQAAAGGPVHPTKGRRSWFRPSAPADAQRGFPEPLGGAQRRAKGSTHDVDPWGGVSYVEGPHYSAGANQYVPNFGKVYSNPIGAGIVATHRPQATYGQPGQYFDSQIFWTTKAVPTSINPAGLVDPQELQALLGDIFVQAVVRTTG